jgi:hypothetical protein
MPYMVISPRPQGPEPERNEYTGWECKASHILANSRAISLYRKHRASGECISHVRRRGYGERGALKIT